MSNIKLSKSEENYLKSIFDDVKIIYEENTNNVLKRVCCKNFKI